MKNFRLFSVLLVIIVLGCEISDENSSIESQDIAYVLHLDDSYSVYEISSAYPIDLNKASSSNKNGVLHAHGNFQGYDGLTTFNFTATINNGGKHGNAQLYKSSPIGNLHLKMKTNCLTIVDNVAVYAGIVTDIIESPFPQGTGPIQIGSVLFFKVKDNGNGQNGLPDQYAPMIIVGSARAGCDSYIPDAPIWEPLVDVTHANDIIVVN